MNIDKWGNMDTGELKNMNTDKWGNMDSWTLVNGKI